MSVAKEMSTLHSLVMHLLESDERLRDSDKKLSSRIWCNELGGTEMCKAISAYEFFCLYSNGKLTTQESIGRVRREIQEDNPHLRGKNYGKRQAHQEDVVIELGYGNAIQGGR